MLFVLAGAASAASVNLTHAKAADIALTGAAGGLIDAGVVDAFTDGGNVMLLNWRASVYSGFSEVGHELTLHNADGSFAASLATFSGTAFKSFVRKHGDDIYFGLDANIYRVSYSSPSAPVAAAALGNNYDMQFDAAGNAYAVANPGWAGNHIYQVDLTGGNSHTVVVANAGTYSAVLAIDGAGDLYYGTYNFGPNDIRSFSAAQLAAASAAGAAMAFMDGAHVTDLTSGAGGMAFDAAANLVFTLNDFGSPGELCVIEAGAAYTGTQKYGRLSGVNYFTTCVDAVGDVMTYDVTGEAVYTAGGATLSVVPEPAAAMALGLGGLAALLGRRRRR